MNVSKSKVNYKGLEVWKWGSIACETKLRAVRESELLLVRVVASGSGWRL